MIWTLTQRLPPQEVGENDDKCLALIKTSVDLVSDIRSAVTEYAKLPSSGSSDGSASLRDRLVVAVNDCIRCVH